MRDVAHRITAYESKSVPANVAAVVTAQLPDMKSGFAGKVQSLYTVEASIQARLNGYIVPTIQYPFYLNFGREMWALSTRGISGPSLTPMAQSLKDKYELYGLSSANLISIASDEFQVVVT